MDIELLPTSPSSSITSNHPSTPSLPPTYILPLDPPSHSASASLPPAYPSREPVIDTYSAGSLRSTEELPRYTPEGEVETEPKTLARSLWMWGWLFPLLWAFGLCILWIPLRPEEEETDPEKAQKLQEMIVILRKTELKYARRCMYSFLAFMGFLIAVTVVGVVLSRVL